MQQPAGPPRANLIAGSIMLIGGVLAILGSALSWGRVSVGRLLGSRSISAAGTNSTHGKIILALGILTAIVGMLVAVVPRREVVRAAAAVAVAAGLAVTALTIYNIATKNQQFTRGFRRGFEQVTGRRLTDAEVRVLAAQFGIRLTLAPGLFVALAGGLIGAIGGVAGVTTGGGIVPQPVGTTAATAEPGPTETTPSEPPGSVPPPPP